MRLETVLRAALRDLQSGRETPHCGRPPSQIDNMDPLANVEWAIGYAEPGYDTPIRGVLLANWNQYPTRLVSIVERLGYVIEWSDEWATCDGCQRIVRTSPDSYSWRRSYVVYHDCEIVCAQCVTENLDKYETSLLNNPEIADTFDIDWIARGFVKMNVAHFENGFYPGQNDVPKDIARQVPVAHDFLFAIPTCGQFDISFDCWIRPQEKGE